MFNALISAYEKSGISEKAMEVFKELWIYGVEPDIVTYNSMISVYGKVDDEDGMRSVTNCRFILVV